MRPGQRLKDVTRGGVVWQARRDSNPQHPVLETGALPLELLAYTPFAARDYLAECYLVSL
jgi:hypothetical protein